MQSMLVEKTAPRTEELMRKLEPPPPQLDSAVTDEMGHALCGFKEEGKADACWVSTPPPKANFLIADFVKMHDKFPVKVQADVWGGNDTAGGGGGEQVRSIYRRDCLSDTSQNVDIRTQTGISQKSGLLGAENLLVKAEFG